MNLSYCIPEHFSSEMYTKNHFSYFLQLFRLVFVYFFVFVFIKRFVFINHISNIPFFSDTLCVKNASYIETPSFS